MLKTLKVLASLLFFFISNIAFSQNIEGLKEIVKAQQDKISIIEDNLKKLIGSIEEQSNLNNSETSLKLIQSQVNEINQKLILLENNIKNVTNLSYNLEFALKRIERHLELSSIQNVTKKEKKEANNKNDYKSPDKLSIKKKSLDTKTEGVLGFIKETEGKEEKDDKDIGKKVLMKKITILH